MRIFCIGRNYRDHAKELGNDVPTEPLVFMKPYESLISIGHDIIFPKHGKQLQHEVEVVVKIGTSRNIEALALGLDLTLRDVQNQLKAKGMPWEKAKSFECSATVTEFTPYSSAINLNSIEFACKVNGQLRQQGHTKDMLFSIQELIDFLSGIWSLQQGDLIYTGTPAGVGDLQVGDKIEVFSSCLGSGCWTIL